MCRFSPGLSNGFSGFPGFALLKSHGGLSQALEKLLTETWTPAHSCCVRGRGGGPVWRGGGNVREGRDFDGVHPLWGVGGGGMRYIFRGWGIGFPQLQPGCRRVSFPCPQRMELSVIASHLGFFTLKTTTELSIHSASRHHWLFCLLVQLSKALGKEGFVRCLHYKRRKVKKKTKIVM